MDFDVNAGGSAYNISAHAFNESALTLYEWAPVAEELKSLDRKIVLNSMILKWENVQKEFYQLVK